MNVINESIDERGPIKGVTRKPVYAEPPPFVDQRGGPKNLPVASEFVGDEDEDGPLVPLKDKPRLVIVGEGWGVHPFSSHPPSCSNISRATPLACCSPPILEVVK